MIGFYLFIVFVLIIYGYLIDPFLSVASEEDGIKRSDMFKQHCIFSIAFPAVLVLMLLFELVKRLFRLFK